MRGHRIGLRWHGLVRRRRMGGGGGLCLVARVCDGLGWLVFCRIRGGGVGRVVVVSVESWGGICGLGTGLWAGLGVFFLGVAVALGCLACWLLGLNGYSRACSVVEEVFLVPSRNVPLDDLVVVGLEIHHFLVCFQS